jgi:hypothetical protein
MKFFLNSKEYLSHQQFPANWFLFDDDDYFARLYMRVCSLIHDAPISLFIVVYIYIYIYDKLVCYLLCTMHDVRLMGFVSHPALDLIRRIYELVVTKFLSGFSTRIQALAVLFRALIDPL